MKIRNLLFSHRMPLLLLVISIASCDIQKDKAQIMAEGFGVMDVYPEVQSGSTNISGIVITNIGDEKFPVMVALNNGCMLITNWEKYGKHSSKLLPKKILCRPNNDKTVTDKYISASYFDNRIFGNKNHKIIFQIYDESILNKKG
jgi:hypothetical protein